MGETQDQLFQLSSNAYLKVDFHGSRVTPDGGLILVRELDEQLGRAICFTWKILGCIRMPLGRSIKRSSS